MRKRNLSPMEPEVGEWVRWSISIAVTLLVLILQILVG